MKKPEGKEHVKVDCGVDEMCGGFPWDSLGAGGKSAGEDLPVRHMHFNARNNSNKKLLKELASILKPW